MKYPCANCSGTGESKFGGVCSRCQGSGVDPYAERGDR